MEKVNGLFCFIHVALLWTTKHWIHCPRTWSKWGRTFIKIVMLPISWIGTFLLFQGLLMRAYVDPFILNCPKPTGLFLPSLEEWGPPEKHIIEQLKNIIEQCFLPAMFLRIALLHLFSLTEPCGCKPRSCNLSISKGASSQNTQHGGSSCVPLTRLRLT